MNTQVAQLSPPSVWTCFERLNEVPRPSKKEERVIAFMKKFGEDLGLETLVDKTGNVIIRKPATAGMEDRKTAILQAHLDMVHQKNADTSFDFSKEGIRSRIEDGWVKAEGTTLGSDNGMGVASIMAILQSKDIPHGPIEALFTIDEETGMTGANGLEPGLLKGEILLNTDTEDEGELTIGCAGGLDNNISWTYPEVSAPDGQAYHLVVKGLRGGHSGVDIHLGRGNANKIMNRVLWGAHKYHLSIAQIDGGGLRNAIPRESSAIVVVPEAHAAKFEHYVAHMQEVISKELHSVEPNLRIQLEVAEHPVKVMDTLPQQQFLNALYASPNGVIRMSADVDDLVETSTSLARVLLKGGKATVQFLSRSSVDSAKEDLAHAISATFQLIGAKVEHSGSYPGWAPNPDSEILELMKVLYKDLFDTPAHVVAVHAGLECGIIGSHYPGLDMISFGPTIKNPHSPDEMVEIETVEKYWKFLLATLAHIPKK